MVLTQSLELEPIFPPDSQTDVKVQTGNSFGPSITRVVLNNSLDSNDTSSYGFHIATPPCDTLSSFLRHTRKIEALDESGNTQKLYSDLGYKDCINESESNISVGSEAKQSEFIDSPSPNESGAGLFRFATLDTTQGSEHSPGSILSLQTPDQKEQRKRPKLDVINPDCERVSPESPGIQRTQGVRQNNLFLQFLQATSKHSLFTPCKKIRNTESQFGNNSRSVNENNDHLSFSDPNILQPEDNNTALSASVGTRSCDKEASNKLHRPEVECLVPEILRLEGSSSMRTKLRRKQEKSAEPSLAINNKLPGAIPVQNHERQGTKGGARFSQVFNCDNASSTDRIHGKKKRRLKRNSTWKGVRKTVKKLKQRSLEMSVISKRKR